jgi:Fe-S oxidoreductase
VWKEEKEGSRINYKRLDQLLEAKPETIAVGCPFCMLMLDDAVKGKNLDETVQVKDLVEIIAESLEASQEGVRD